MAVFAPFSIACVQAEMLAVGEQPELAKLLCVSCGADVGWLTEEFSLGLSLVACLDGHSAFRSEDNACPTDGVAATGF